VSNTSCIPNGQVAFYPGEVEPVVYSTAFTNLEVLTWLIAFKIMANRLENRG
jgi:hypothetical protein